MATIIEEQKDFIKEIIYNKYLIKYEKDIPKNYFKKTYTNQYDFMLHTFKTLIELNNCFYSDSNLSLADKVENAINIMEKYIYIDIDKEKYRYSVRFINNIFEKYSTYLYRKISNIDNGWYVLLEPLTVDEIKTSIIVKNVMEEIEQEITRLDNVGFDSIVKEQIDYQRNSNRDYKIYISKFDNLLYTQNKAFLKAYKSNYNEVYGNVLDDEIFTDIAIVYNLVAKANNGIVNILQDTPTKDYNLNEKSTPQDYYYAYLDTLNISVDDFMFRINSMAFMYNAMLTYVNICAMKPISIDEMINNFDLFYFFDKMANLFNNDEITIANDMITKIITDLKQVYQILNKKIANIDEMRANFRNAYEIITKIIDRNKDYFIKVS